MDDDDSQDSDVQGEKRVASKQYFASNEARLLEMAAEIEDREMKDFGGLLKGNDLFNEGFIQKKTLFQVIQQVFDTLGEGDVLCIVNFFDR